MTASIIAQDASILDAPTILGASYLVVRRQMLFGSYAMISKPKILIRKGRMMDCDFIHLENDLILNIDKILAIVKNHDRPPDEDYLHFVLMDGTNKEIAITKKDYDIIRDYLFGFHPNYGPEKEEGGG